jgi:hypothetical protein
VRKPRSLERIPRLQKQQMSEERKANSIERQKQKKGYVSKGNCMDFCFLWTFVKWGILMFSNLHDRDLNIISGLLNDNNKIIFNWINIYLI